MNPSEPRPTRVVERTFFAMTCHRDIMCCIDSVTVVLCESSGERFLMHKLPDRANMVLRLPRDIKRWLEREAAENASSQNSEIIRAIRQRMESEARAGG